jgi:hypothetical protein
MDLPLMAISARYLLNNLRRLSRDEYEVAVVDLVIAARDYH